MNKLFRGLAHSATKKNESTETTKVLNRENTPSFTDDQIDFDNLFDLEGDFEITDDFLDATEVADPDKTSASFSTPPRYPNRQRVFQDLETTAPFRGKPHIPTREDLLPFIDPDYEEDLDPRKFFEPSNGTKFGDPVDDITAKGKKEYLKSIDTDLTPEEHQKQLLSKIKKLRRDLREGSSWGSNRLRKIIQLSICENIYKRIL